MAVFSPSRNFVQDGAPNSAQLQLDDINQIYLDVCKLAITLDQNEMTVYSQVSKHSLFETFDLIPNLTTFDRHWSMWYI